MKYFDAFSGYGGFSLGILRAYESLHSQSENERLQDEGNIPGSDGLNVQGATCIGYSEINKYAIETYSKHFPYEECEPCYIRRLQSDDSKRPEELNDATNELQQWERSDNCQCKHKNYGDLTKINAEELPDFDLFVGGFPCQAFSIAGKRKGFDDTRGTLFFDIARILRAKRPRLLLLENVKGLLSHDNGKTFSTIISTLDEIGYDLQWQVLNAKHFGVPQNRERVFIIGHLRGTSRPEVFPITGSNPKNLEQIIGGGQGNRIYSTNGVACTQASQAGGQGAKTGLYAIPEATKKGYALAREGDSINLSVPNSKTRRGRVGGGVAQTLDTAAQQYTIQDCKIRRLTPTECERLMGLPDGWTEGHSDTQRYKLCGNGVVVNVVEEIIKRML